MERVTAPVFSANATLLRNNEKFASLLEVWMKASFIMHEL
jgi:hypothetical protein